MSALQAHHAQSIKADADLPDSIDPIRSDKPRDIAVRRESKLTFGGLIYIGVTVFLAVGAVNSQNNLLFWLFGVAIATIIVSGLFSGNALMKTRLRARVLHEVHAGQPQRLHYTIRNRSRFFPLFAALVSEETEKVVKSGKLVPASVVHVAPRSMTSTQGSFTPMRRGRYVLRKIRLSTRFPFGLLQKSLIFEHPRPLLVLPHELQLKQGLISSVPTQGEQVLRKSERGGTSNEFWGMREYRPGDPARRISWKHSARRDDLVVVEHAESYALRIWVVIAEPSAIDNEQHTLHAERAITIAASLFEDAGRRSTPVGLWYPQRSVRFEPHSGRAQSGRAVRALAMIDLDEPAEQFAAVPVRTRDRVVLIQRGTHAPSGVAAARIINTEQPGTWLSNPASLPEHLRGES